MKWPTGWTKPVYRRRRGRATGYVSPLTKRAGGSIGIGPIRITTTGRVYLFGARIK